MATKTTALLITISILCLAIALQPDYTQIALQPECTYKARLTYSFFHTSIFHAAINAYCLLGIAFLHTPPFKHLILAYITAATYPVNTISNLLSLPPTPTVGLSAALYFLLASISFNVQKKITYQAFMLTYLTIGFFLPHVNPYIHLYAYTLGLIFALHNKKRH